MNILFGSAQPYVPEVAGGTQVNTHETAIELRRRGHRVSVAAGLTGLGWAGLRSRLALKLGQRAARSISLGYPTYRSWQATAAVEQAIRRERPDVAVIPTTGGIPLADVAKALGIPVVVYLHDVQFWELDGDVTSLKADSFLANSQFTADAYRTEVGITATVVPPLFRAEQYRTATSREFVTFINPHPDKGVATALDLAERCPDIPFRIISGWSLSPETAKWLDARLTALPNVQLVQRTSNMRSIYARTKVLLAPSRWREGWGRVVSEAQFSGIPAIASSIGGLPESVGPGGVLIDPAAPLEAWVATLRRVWDDELYYQHLSEAALAHSSRPELTLSRQLEVILSVLTEAIGARNRSIAPTATAGG